MLRCLLFQRRYYHCIPLRKRGLLSLDGPDTLSFLQGLVTNDVASLATKPAALYTLMLDVKGRVINDFIIYRPDTPNESGQRVFLDVDLSAISNTLAILKRYKLRRKITFEDVTGKYAQYALLDATPAEFLQLQDRQKSAILFAGDDPRSSILGRRLLVSASKWSEPAPSDINDAEERYRFRRYALGIPEGVDELPPGACLPLESNADFLNGVSFDKGCYVGQELTARTHHIGVIRKRLTPITLENSVENWKPRDKIQLATTTTTNTQSNRTQKPVGDLRVLLKTRGLALLRLQHIITGDALVLESSGQKFAVKAEWPISFPTLDELVRG